MKEDRGGKVFVDSTRVGGATVIAAYSPRVRPGVPVSFPVAWDDLDDIAPADFTVHTALRQLGDRDPWADADARPAAPAAPSSSRRATPSRSLGCRPCTRASAAPARLAGNGPGPKTRPCSARRDSRSTMVRNVSISPLKLPSYEPAAKRRPVTAEMKPRVRNTLRQPGAFRDRLESDVPTRPSG